LDVNLEKKMFFCYQAAMKERPLTRAIGPKPNLGIKLVKCNMSVLKMHTMNAVDV